MHHDRRAKARFVGECAALEAPCDGLRDAVAQNAAARCRQCKRALEDGCKCGRDRREVCAHHDQRAYDVHDRHNGDDLLCDSRHTLQTAQNDQSGQKHQRNACDHVRDVERRAHIACNGVDLAHVANTERCQHAEAGEQHRQHPAQRPAALLCAQTVGQIVHSTAGPLALFVLAAVENAQNILGVVGHHAEDRHDPHPEDGTRAAADDRRGNAHDVARTNGGRKRRTKALELADGHILFVRMGCYLFVGKDGSNGVFHPVANVPELKSACPHRHDQTGAEQQRQTDRPPDHSIDRAVDACDGIQHPDFPLLLKNAGRNLSRLCPHVRMLIPHSGAHLSRQSHLCVCSFLPRTLLRIRCTQDIIKFPHTQDFQKKMQELSVWPCLC